MKYVGYHRTSTREQHLDRGIIEIESYCKSNLIDLKKIYTDQSTGKNFNRPRYTVLKEDVLEPGDVLIITEVDRLGRNKEGILQELRYYKEKGIRIMILELPTTLIKLPEDDSVAKMMIETINNILIEIYSSLAQAEYEKKKKRQQEGIEAKKIRGEWNDYGRPRIMSQEHFNQEYEKVIIGHIKPFELMRSLDMKKATFYKYIKEGRKEVKK